MYVVQCLCLMHTELSLLIRAGDFWWVSDEVGKKGGWLKAKVVRDMNQLRPPHKGWQFCDDRGEWESDPTMVCSKPLPCTVVYREAIVTVLCKAMEMLAICVGCLFFIYLVFRSLGLAWWAFGYIYFHSPFSLYHYLIFILVAIFDLDSCFPLICMYIIYFYVF